MRVNVQLIDAETGNHLWAERFDKPLADLFDMQDEIVARLAGALNANSSPPRRDERTGPEPRTRWTSIFRGWLGSRGLTPENVAQARGFFDRALTADPDNVDALIGSAAPERARGRKFLCDRSTAAFAAAEAKLTKALSSVPDHARGHMSLGYVEICTKRAARASPNVNMRWSSIEISPTPIPLSGLVRFLSVAPKKPRLTLAEALRLSPRDTMAYIWMAFAGIAKVISAVRSRRPRGFDGRSRPTEIFRHRIFAWLPPSAQLGRLDEARSAVRAGLALDPTFAVSRARAVLDGEERRPEVSGSARTLFDGLRKAGMPEESPPPLTPCSPPSCPAPPVPRRGGRSGCGRGSTRRSRAPPVRRRRSRPDRRRARRRRRA